jgi:hypothetical protein
MKIVMHTTEALLFSFVFWKFIIAPIKNMNKEDEEEGW